MTDHPVDPFVCPEGHHAIEIGRDRAWCETCRLRGDPSAFDRSEIRDLRVDA